MKSFNRILNESKGANKHLTHLEDTFLDWNEVSGIQTSINFLEDISNNLSGHTSKTQISTKFDGAPAIICGVNPSTKKFFVGTKSVFNKEPKINYTNEDIDKNHSGELANILKLCLEYLSKLGIKGILQGDLMFIPAYKKPKTIDGIKYITFQPNTILYAIPQDSDLAKTINSAKIGIVFHTQYKSMENPSASYNINISSLKKSKDVWFTDAYFKDVSGNINFTKEESQQFKNELDKLKSLVAKLPANKANDLLQNKDLIDLVKVFNNSRVRVGEFIANPEKHVQGLITWVKERFNKEADKVKSDVAKMLKTSKADEIVKYIEDNSQLLVSLFTLQSEFVRIKGMIVKKLEAGKHLDSFVQKDNGFEYTGPEGFVAVDSIGNAVKLVDRLVFSTNNFNAVKSW